MTSKNRQKNKPLTADDILKYETAEELGLLDKVEKHGWGCLTSKESGQLGGIINSKKHKNKKADT